MRCFSSLLVFRKALRNLAVAALRLSALAAMTTPALLRVLLIASLWGATSAGCGCCPAGQYCKTTSTSSGGSYFTSNACTVCANGRFSTEACNNGGSAACSATCPAGTFVAAGGTACVACAPDTFSRPLSAGCTECSAAPNSMAPTGALGSCGLSCFEGTFAAPGNTTCETCGLNENALPDSGTCFALDFSDIDGTAASFTAELIRRCEAKCFAKFADWSNGASVSQEYVTEVWKYHPGSNGNCGYYQKTNAPHALDKVEKCQSVCRAAAFKMAEKTPAELDNLGAAEIKLDLGCAGCSMGAKQQANYRSLLRKLPWLRSRNYRPGVVHDGVQLRRRDILCNVMHIRPPTHDRQLQRGGGGAAAGSPRLVPTWRARHAR